MNARNQKLTPRGREDLRSPLGTDPENARPAAALTGVFLIGLFLILSSWLFGGVTLWTRQILFAVAVLPFLLALAPIPHRRKRIGAWGTTRRALGRLATFPPFWLGLLVFGYVWLQWTNPAWTYTEMGGRWWISSAGLRPDPDWPSSIYAPAAKGNPLSFLLRFGAVWMIVCAGRILIRRRKELLGILVAFSINAFIVAMVAIIQEMQPPDKVLWLYPWEGKDFAGPFFYRNHGGAFFYLSMAVSFGLALYFQRTRDPRTQKSSPGPIFVIFGLVNAGATAASGSRAGWIFGTAVLLVYLVLTLGVWLGRKQWRGSWIGGITVAGCLAILAASVIASQNQDQLEHHFRRFLSIPAELEYSGRTVGNEASLRMLQDVMVFGYGADSYGHAFALYFDEFPELVRKHRRTDAVVRNRWVQAHNDPLQYAVELGVVGASVLALIPLYFLGVFLFRLIYFRPESVLWFAGTVILFTHSFAELLFQSVPLLALFAFLLLGVEKSLSFERRKIREDARGES